ncbi:hypothetical protein CCACVL1_21174 [Corchorus capsularis]|uniref:Uncharacterized protein n=1 Tax=Corchorus capsularis TaxID=210143 RepID=A0A1R3H7T7_COCAP|nr:hypothetical protein CCACVL1_21174 [Corchorus capsularis]
MEGLIPFVYRAFVQYKNGREGVLATWFNESPSASYMRLPTGDSGRFQFSDHNGNFSASSSTSMAASSSSQIILSTGVQSPVCRLTSRRVVT